MRTSELFGLTIVFSCCVLVTTASSQPIFGGRTDHDGGLGPIWVDAADLNGDGDEDLVVINQCFSCGPDLSYSILLNDGSGSYPAVGVKTSLPFPPGLGALADLDSDGDIDLAIAGAWSADHSVFVLLNDGTGDLGAPVEFSVCVGSEWDIDARDFDGDGDLDLAVVCDETDVASVLFNDGLANFSEPLDISVAADPQFLCSGDFDGDGDFDIAVTGLTDGIVSVLSSDGVGLFSRSDFPVGNQPSVIACGDLDGDSDVDLTVETHPNDSLWVMLNDGTGSFNRDAGYAGDASGFAVSLSDIDLDGCPDVTTLSYTSESVAIRRNECDGILAPPVTFSVDDPDFPYGPLWICSSDFDKDGDADFAVANYNGGQVTILRNFALGQCEVIPAVTPVCPFSASDSNCDGVLDIIDVVNTINAAFRGQTSSPPCCRFE